MNIQIDEIIKARVEAERAKKGNIIIFAKQNYKLAKVVYEYSGIHCHCRLSLR